MADMLGFSGTGAIQFLRTLRALGPLRALSRFPGLRVRPTLTYTDRQTDRHRYRCVSDITAQSSTGGLLS